MALSLLTTVAATCGEIPGRRGALHDRVVLFRLRGVTVATFGLFAGIGGAVGAWMALARMHQAGLEPARFGATMFVLVPVLAIAGSRLFSAILEGEPILSSPRLLLRKHGFCFQGGFVLATAGVCLTALAHGLDLLLVLDCFALAMPLGHAFGRLGCHTYGCCHGRPTRSPLALRYTNPESKAVWRSGLSGVPVHPTQLYSAAGNLALFALLAFLATRPLVAGQLAATYLVAGAAGRFAIEFLHGASAPSVGGLTPFQLVAGALATLGVGLFLALADGAARPLFAHLDLAGALARVGGQAWVPSFAFVVLFTALGLQGRRIGRPS